MQILVNAVEQTSTHQKAKRPPYLKKEEEEADGQLIVCVLFLRAGGQQTTHSDSSDSRGASSSRPGNVPPVSSMTTLGPDGSSRSSSPLQEDSAQSRDTIVDVNCYSASTSSICSSLWLSSVWWSVSLSCVTRLNLIRYFLVPMQCTGNSGAAFSGESGEQP